MASTLSGQGKGSRGPIHVYEPGTLGTLCGRGERAVTFKNRSIGTCRLCVKAIEKTIKAFEIEKVR